MDATFPVGSLQVNSGRSVMKLLNWMFHLTSRWRRDCHFPLCQLLTEKLPWHLFLLCLLPFSFLTYVATKSWRLHRPFLFINPGFSLTQFRPPYLFQALPDWLVGTDLHLLFHGTQGEWGEHIRLCNSPNKILSHTPLHTIMSKSLFGGEKSPPSCTSHPPLTPRVVSTA